MSPEFQLRQLTLERLRTLAIERAMQARAESLEAARRQDYQRVHQLRGAETEAQFFAEALTNLIQEFNT